MAQVAVGGRAVRARDALCAPHRANLILFTFQALVFATLAGAYIGEALGGSLKLGGSLPRKGLAFLFLMGETPYKEIPGRITS